LIYCFNDVDITCIDDTLQEKLRLVTVLGAGLLVGTALAVIIPEGVHTLYTTEHGETRNISHLCRFWIIGIDRV